LHALADTTVIAVHVGSGTFNQAELNLVASNPATDVFLVFNENSDQQLIARVLEVSCGW